MAYRITDQWIIPVKQKQFRQGSIIKPKLAQSVIPKFNAKAIEEIDNIIAELEELQVLRKLPLDEQFNKLDEAEEDEKDLDSDELLQKRRLEESKTHESKYSVLEYNQASVSGDKLMQKLKGNYKISEQGDNLMKNLGVSNY